jgi:GNAT superfamily N-acetyltransferase
MVVRPLGLDDYNDAYRLYKELVGDTPVPDGGVGMRQFARVIDHPGTTIYGVQRDGEIRSMATLHLLPNMTFAGRPYGLVENVVTLRAYQGQGFGRQVMTHIRDIAWEADAYKVMLLTGQAFGNKGFYEALGYTADEKHGMTMRRVPPRAPRD